MTLRMGHQEENNTHFLSCWCGGLSEQTRLSCSAGGMRRIYFIALFAISALIKLHRLIVTCAIPRKGGTSSLCHSDFPTFPWNTEVWAEHVPARNRKWEFPRSRRNSIISLLCKAILYRENPKQSFRVNVTPKASLFW